VNPQRFLEGLFNAALLAVDPLACVPPHLPKPPKGRTIVVGAGKAAAAMARAVEKHWQGELSGLVVTRYGHGVTCQTIEVLEAAHPVPDAAGIAAAKKILGLIQGLSKDDLVLFLGSGGGSSLLTLPAGEITLEDKQAITHALLVSGAGIAEINCVRKHLSAIKGGRLVLAAAPARVCGLLISDVANDDPAIIASGPTLPDSSTQADARAVLRRYDIDVPQSVKKLFSYPRFETPKPNHPRFASVENVIVANAKDALKTAARKCDEGGTRATILDSAVEGSAIESAAAHANAVRGVLNGGGTLPNVLLSGGEVTVTLSRSRSEGIGGPNTEFLLALALALEPASEVWALACDTDGLDGIGDNAGAFLSPHTLLRAHLGGLDPQDYLARNDSYSFFKALGGLISTGPTRTNVNDFRAILIRERAKK
jgi:glycerate 2-kinase